MSRERSDLRHRVGEPRLHVRFCAIHLLSAASFRNISIQGRDGLTINDDIMKPGSRDHRHKLLIQGRELQELKRHSGAMCEAFGLDGKIEKYKGKRPITLYRWDLDCLIDVIGLALNDRTEYPSKSSPDYFALKSLGDRLREEYQRVYGHD